MVHQSYRSRTFKAVVRLLLLAGLRECWAARTLHQDGQVDNAVCLAFVPYRYDDYAYMRDLSDDRRRESFATARDRCIDIGGLVPTDGSAWDFQGLSGNTHLAAEPEALQAFPKMDKRSDDLYTAFINACIQDATGEEANDSVGDSTRKPYYFVHTVCKGDCASLTPEQQIQIDTSARNARAVISCVDSAALAADPYALPLPFTPDGSLPAGTTQATSFAEALTAANNGNTVIFHTPQADEDLAAAAIESEAALEELFITADLVPAPAPGALIPGLAPELAPGQVPGQAPGAAPGPAPGGVDEETGRGFTGNISWILVGVGFVGAIIAGAGIMLAKHFGIALGYSCCQCTACAGIIGRKGSSEMSISPTAVAGGPTPSPGAKAIKASAFESAAFSGTQATATASPALLGGANSSSGDDSVDFLAAPAGPSSNGPPGGGTGRAGALNLTSAFSGTTGAIYRTTSHSGSVSLAHLTPLPPGVPVSSASNGKESQGGESSGDVGNVGSGDSTHLPPCPPLLGTAVSASSPAYDVERPESGGGEERGSRVLGTVFEIEAQNTDVEAQPNTASHVVSRLGDSEGLTKPLDEISASMLENDVSPVDSQDGSGASDDALLSWRAARSDSGMAPPAAEATSPSPKRRHVFSSLLPSISTFRSASAEAVQDSAGASTSAAGPAAGP